MSSYEDGLRELYGDDAVDPRGDQTDTPDNKEPIGPEENENSGSNAESEKKQKKSGGDKSSGSDSGRAARLLDGSAGGTGGSSGSEDSGSNNSSDGQSVRERFPNAPVERDDLPTPGEIESPGQQADVSDLPTDPGGNQTPNKSTQQDPQRDSLVEQGREQRNDDGEAFGGRGEVEQRLRDASKQFRDKVADRVGDVAGDVADVTQSGVEASAASNPAALLTGQSSAEDVQQEIQSGDERVRDVARAPENEESSRRTGEMFGEGVGQGAAELLNAPQYGVTAIEAGEVAVAGAEAAPVTGGSPAETREFADAVSAAAAAQAADTADAARDNPAEFGGQLVGGALAGSAAGTALRTVSGRTPSANLDVSGGSNQIREFLDDSRAQGQVPRSRSDATDREITAGDLRVQPRQGPSVRSDAGGSRGGRRDVSSGSSRSGSRGGRSRGTGSRAGRDRGGSARRRREQAERSEVRQVDDGPTGDGDLFDFESVVGGGVLGADLQQQAQGSEVMTGPGLDVGVGPGVGVDQGVGPDTDTPTDTDTPQRNGPGQRTPTDNDIPRVFNPDRPRPRERTPDPGRPRDPDRPLIPDRPRNPGRPRVPDDDDDDDMLLNFGRGGSGRGSESGEASGAATGFVAETLAGFGEGGLNLDAAQAADSADSGFLSTRAESERSDGFEAARDLFTFGGES